MENTIQTPNTGTESQGNVTPAPEVTPEPVAPQPTASEDPATPSPEGTPPSEPSSPAPQPQADPYKEKFVASQREAILLAEREKIAKARIEQLTKQDTPTDEAMRALYPEWDNLDEYNKRVLIRQETTALQQARILARQQEIDARQQLEDQLDEVVESSDYAPKLKGKEAEFRRFARNPKNRGIDAKVLAKAFLFDVEAETPQTPTSQPMTTEALPTGSGGPREPQKPKKISLEEARTIRQTDSKRYMELVKSGQIAEEDI